jgi:hypothetical protein
MADPEPDNWLDAAMTWKGFVTWPLLSRGLQSLLGGLGTVLKEEYAKRDVRIDALEIHVRALREKALQPSMQWGGDHEVGRLYTAGEVVRKHGLWLCLQSTESTPGTDPSAWLLALRARKDV